MTAAAYSELADQLRAFGESVRGARQRAHLSKSAVARAVGIDRSAITRIERGVQAPKFSTLLRLARTLDSTPAELLAAIGPAEPMPLSNDGVAPDRPAKRFGENLRLARAGAGVSQADLALDAPTDWSLLSGYETGKRAPNLRSILKLAHSLGVSPAALLCDVR